MHTCNMGGIVHRDADMRSCMTADLVLRIKAATKVLGKILSLLGAHTCGCCCVTFT